MKEKPKLIVFASGSKYGGGSGFEKLVKAIKSGVLNAEIVAVVSNYENGGVREHAEKLGIPFEHFKAPYTLWGYVEFIKKYDAEWVILSGWLKLVPMRNYEKGIDGLDPAKTINIHPGPLPRFGGKGMYGVHVQKAVVEARKRGEPISSAVTMHFATYKYDEGPIFFVYPVEVKDDDTAKSLGKRVNDVEHEWQPRITNMVVHGEISWDGKDPKTLKVPEGYEFLPVRLRTQTGKSWH